MTYGWADRWNGRSHGLMSRGMPRTLNGMWWFCADTHDRQLHSEDGAAHLSAELEKDGRMTTDQGRQRPTLEHVTEAVNIGPPDRCVVDGCRRLTGESDAFCDPCLARLREAA